MPEMILVLEDGSTVQLEVDESLDGEFAFASRGDKLRDESLRTFEKGIATAAEFAKKVQKTLSSTGLNYCQAQLNLGITFTAGADVKILQGSAAATVQLSLTWDAQIPGG